MEEEIKNITDDLEIIDLLRKLVKTKERLWSWQIDASSTQKRKIQFSVLRKVDPIKKLITARPTNMAGFQFDKGQELFLYSPEQKIAGKIQIREIEKDFIILSIPTTLNTISEKLISQITFIEQEDEGAHAHQRSTPRQKAKEGQIIKVKRESDQTTLQYTLYDLSSGGMGIKINDPGEFQVGDIIFLEEIDGKSISPLRGEVLSVRMINKDDFKVGVIFKKE